MGFLCLFSEISGEFSTYLPISPIEYRDQDLTDANIEVIKTEKEIHFQIMDDYGERYELIISGEEKNNPIVQREKRITLAMKGK